MKKLAVLFVVLSVAMVGLIGYTVKGFAGNVKKVEASEVKQRVSNEKELTTEYVMIQSVSEDGRLEMSAPIQEDSKLINGYLVDNKFQLGDIVEITYHNDDLVTQRKVTGKELEEVECVYAKEINAVMEDGINQETKESEQLVTLEDGSQVSVSWFADENGNIDNDDLMMIEEQGVDITAYLPQCEEGEVLAEDYTCVPQSFYASGE